MKGRILKFFALCVLFFAVASPLSALAQSGQRFHTIQKGETLYALTKLYRVTAADICAANPGLSAANFKIGAVVLIPEASSKATAEKKDTVTVKVQEHRGIAGSDCREMHAVKRKETLYSIARDFGVTFQELQEANPETKKEGFVLKKKMVLCIPYHDVAAEQKKAAPTNEELFHQAKKPSSGLSLIRMGVILPLKEKTATAKRALDYYRGLLMAVDSLKRTGLSFEIHTFDAGQTAEDLEKVLQKPEMSSLDIIFGPVDPTQIQAVSKLSKTSKIPVVVPFYSRSEEVRTNPYLFVLNAPDSVQDREVTNLFHSVFANHNVLLIETGDVVEPLVAELKKNLKDIRYASLPLSENVLFSRLDPNRENVIVLTAADIKFFNILMPVLKGVLHAHPQLKVKLFGYPGWLPYTSNLLEEYYVANTYIYSPFFLDYASAGYRRFSNEFHRNFHEEMLSVTPRVAVYGFDSGIYFLKSMQRHGRDFVGKEVYLHPMQHVFRMERENNWSGLVNRQMQFVHYAPSHQTEIIEKK